MKETAKSIAAVVLVIAMLAAMALVMVTECREIVDRHKYNENIEQIVAFGEKHDPAVDFTLRCGESVKIRTEIGDLLICLPQEGDPKILRSWNDGKKDGTSHF